MCRSFPASYGDTSDHRGTFQQQHTPPRPPRQHHTQPGTTQTRKKRFIMNKNAFLRGIASLRGPVRPGQPSGLRRCSRAHISELGTDIKNLAASDRDMRAISPQNPPARSQPLPDGRSYSSKVARMALFRTLRRRSAAARRPKNYLKNPLDSPRPPLSGSPKKKGYFFPLICCGIYLKHLDFFFNNKSFVSGRTVL